MKICKNKKNLFNPQSKGSHSFLDKPINNILTYTYHPFQVHILEDVAKLIAPFFPCSTTGNEYFQSMAIYQFASTSFCRSSLFQATWLSDRCLNILVVTDHVRDALSGLQPVVWHVSRLHATYRTGNASRNRPGRRIRWILNEPLGAIERWPDAGWMMAARWRRLREFFEEFSRNDIDCRRCFKKMDRVREFLLFMWIVLSIIHLIVIISKIENGRISLKTVSFFFFRISTLFCNLFFPGEEIWSPVKKERKKGI